MIYFSSFFCIFFTKASCLKCYTGGAVAKVETTCPTGSDVCAKITTAGVWASSCFVKATATGHPGEGCKDITTPTTANYCLCKTDLCNDASTQSAFKLSAMIAASYLMKVFLA